MDEEKQLLIDILNFSPSNSIWAISQDSFEGLPEELKKMIVEKRGYDLCIKIKEENKKYLLDLINKLDLQDKIIHQYIYFGIDQLMFKGFDHLTSCYINRKFPEVNYLIEKHKDILNFME